jgi:hypothetical protein
MTERELDASGKRGKTVTRRGLSNSLGNRPVRPPADVPAGSPLNR